MAFPTLSVSPSLLSPDGALAVDPTLKSQTEAGYEVTRSKFTRMRRKWGVHYDLLNGTDMGLLRAHETAMQGGSLLFTWTHPVSGTAYTVRFGDGGVKGPEVSKGGINLKISFELVQV